MLKRTPFRKIVTWIAIVIVIFVIFCVKLLITSNHPMAITKTFIYVEPVECYFRKVHSRAVEDWNDHKMMEIDKRRSGHGEQGSPTFTDTDEPSELEIKLLEENGHNAMVSDMISLHRAIPDFRTEKCKANKYKKDLPTVSVIIPFYDEHPQTLARTVHSIINRSPPQLLKEIILINDASTKKELYGALHEHFVVQLWGAKIRMYSMDQRSGLIWSRLAGARYATGDVLLFLDCHVEVGYNFLPPLIDPIADDYRSVVTPTLDIIDKKNYEVRALNEGRTVFDWHFHAQRIPMHLDHEDGDLFKTPVMYGAAFAISARYFWELQPDSGLKIYGGDQLEMSFKVNLCGGTLYEAPCSRVAHIYRRFPYKKHQQGIDFKAR